MTPGTEEQIRQTQEGQAKGLLKGINKKLDKMNPQLDRAIASAQLLKRIQDGDKTAEIEYIGQARVEKLKKALKELNKSDSALLFVDARIVMEDDKLYIAVGFRDNVKWEGKDEHDNEFEN